MTPEYLSFVTVATAYERPALLSQWYGSSFVSMLDGITDLQFSWSFQCYWNFILISGFEVPPSESNFLFALKRGCVTAVEFILLYFANYSPTIAMELKVGKEITCKWQNQRLETNRYVSWALFLKLQTAEINFEKLSRWTVFKNPNFNPFQSSSVLPNRGISCFCYAVWTFL